MTSSIQENEMYLASQYCQKYIAELTDLLVAETRVYTAEQKNCENKILNEQNDIAKLKEKINLCNVYIDNNKTRLQQIPKEIKDLEDDIKSCEYEADNTEVPVYTWEYDSWAERSYRVVDDDATYRNERCIERMRERISDDRYAIKRLNDEIRRCEANINSLMEMINAINSCIRKKEALISKIQSNISYLQKSFSALKKEISKEQSELKVLDGKILKGAEYIHNYGMTMSKIYYKDVNLPYSNNDIFSITCSGLNQEIDMLKAATSINSNNIANCSKGVLQFTNQLQDNVSEQAKQLTVKCALEIKKINDTYISAADTMKKALAYLSAYENIHI